MKLSDPNNPNEKKKLIAAGVLGLVAMIVLGYVFFGGGGSKPAPRTTSVTASPSPVKIVRSTDNQPASDSEDLSRFQPINYPVAVPRVPEPDRNVFAFYVPPPPTPTPVKPIPTPTPTPTPPLTASSLSPASIYARTPTDFSLQLTGDKFTPAVHIVMDGREMPTRFINAQQLFTTVPASMIASPGTRTVMARTSNGALYSNPISFNVTQPPAPNYTYVGLIGKPRFNDVAVLQDKTSKDLINVQRASPWADAFASSVFRKKKFW